MSKRQHAADLGEFKRHAVYWIERFGLKDWRINFKSEPQQDGRMASININGEARVAEIILRTGKEKERDQPLERLALHEVLHLVLNDFAQTIARRADDLHPDSVREEHKVLERLIPVLLEER